jgi:uncharacterized protein (DUF1499 family)
VAICGLVFLLLLGLVALSGLSCASGPPTVGPGGRLRPCPKAPACLCSEDAEGKGAVEPLAFTGPPEEAWEKAQMAVEQIGGTIETLEQRYLWATFRSRVFGFVDDLELRLVANQQIIHVRSASRIGYSDLGVNRRRLARLRTRFNALIDQ